MKIEAYVKRRVAAAEKDAGILNERMYRLDEEDGTHRWVRVWVSFYPRLKWFGQEYTGAVHSEKIGKPFVIEGDMFKRLKTWL